jgi:hypothetical protein
MYHWKLKKIQNVYFKMHNNNAKLPSSDFNSQNRHCAESRNQVKKAHIIIKTPTMEDPHLIAPSMKMSKLLMTGNSRNRAILFQHGAIRAFLSQERES